MRAALIAGMACFALVFCAGFALGMLRVIVVAPRIGELDAVLVELPLMLALSWFACRWAIARFGVASEMQMRAAMGASALLLLLAAETMVGMMGMGRDLASQLATYRTTTAQLGLAAQLLFGAMPLLMLRRR